MTFKYFEFYLVLTPGCRFVDRDMVMRFRGGGVGHTSTRAATDVFKKDRDTLDLKSYQARQIFSDVENEDCMSADEDSDERVEVDEGELSESELLDYGYGQGSDSEEEEGQEEDVEAGDLEENDVRIDDLAMLGYADF